MRKIRVQSVHETCSQNIKIQYDVAVIKSNIFEVTQFRNTFLSDLKLVSVMLTQTHYTLLSLFHSESGSSNLYFISLHVAAVTIPMLMIRTL